MPNLVGIGNSQVPTNAMLGGLAYQDSVGEINLEKIKAQTADTAVEIFVYDTRKDSDGGAWRKKTKNTSWYNEDESGTRGARKEFPAVAVIVMESTQCTIYDADNLNLSMWMIFNFGSGSSLAAKTMFYAGGKTVFALNGMICFGGDSSWKDGVTQVKLIEDTSFWRNDTYVAYWTGGIANRNIAGGYGQFVTDPEKRIVAAQVNDIAMTVLPNAPINASTGLPVPTIAVATDGGTNVINDDGTVTQGYSSIASENVDLHPDGHMISGITGATNDNFSLYNINDTTRITFYDARESTGAYDTFLNQGNGECLFEGKSNKIAIAQTLGLLRIEENFSDYATGLHNRTASSYNTGWMIGDIKGAFLSSTDATDVTGSELITNGTFDSDLSSWSGGVQWTQTTNSVGGDSSGKLMVFHTASTNIYISQTITTVSGQFYTMSYKACSDTASKARVWINNNYYDYIEDNNNGHFEHYSHTFQASGTSTEIRLYTNGASRSYWDMVSVRIADPNRAVSDGDGGEKGFYVHGTVPKSPVASGAELMAYGPFASGIGLVQGWDSDLDYGTGDFYYMIWINVSSHSPLQGIWSRQDNDQSSGNRIQLQCAGSGSGQLNFYGGHGQGSITGMKVQLNTWEHIAMVRKGGKMYWYLNGNNVSVYTDATDYTNSGAVLRVGGLSLTSTSVYVQGAYCMSAGKLALFKTGAEAPTPEQMMEIYQDEKKMFAPNAKCNLGSTNPYVRALEYDKDTDTLHVGTDAGRSDFNGLVRINTTSTPVTTVISASNGLIAEQ